MQLTARCRLPHWIPSRDDAGNGTTTLNDLVGTANGTLTNMDAATDWVADADAGGVRALDFNVFNSEYVDLANVAALQNLHGADFAFSAWARSTGTGNNQTIFSTSSVPFGWFVRRNDSSSANSLGVTVYHSTRNAEYTSSNGQFTANSWHFVGFAWDASTKSVKIYINGTETATYSEAITGIGTIASDVSGLKSIGRLGVNGQFFAGRIDDLRIWNQSLNADDFSDLYAAQRGGITNPPLTQYFTGIRSYNRRRKVGT